MAAIIHQKDKRSGITYAYESVSYWDKEKKQSRARRKLIGRVMDDGTIVPTDGRGRNRGKAKQEAKEETLKQLPKRSFYGATYLFDAIGEKLGLTKDLKACFGKRYTKILSLAYYLILEAHSPLFRFEKWGMLHRHPHGEVISSQRSSELFASITEADKNSFLKRWGNHKADAEFWAYDTTSISSYSEGLRQVQYGYNKENDLLAQLNLAIVYGESSNLPFYYRKLAGNIPDAKTLTHLLADLEQLDFGKVKLVMDRGFYSKENLSALFESHRKFLVSSKMSLNFIQKNLEGIYDTFRSYEHYIPEYELYAHTVQSVWEYTQQRPYKGDSIPQKRRIYLHYYFNIEKAAEEEKRFDKRLIERREELMEDRPLKAHQAFYEKYFLVTRTPKRGISVEVKADAVAKAKKYFGFFVLLSNEKMHARRALEIYRNKDVVEKAFGNLKERLNMRRLLVSSEQSLDGKLFVAFIALIYLSYIKKQMQAKKLYKHYTLGSLLDTLDVIECFEYPGKKLRVGELLEKQKEIYAALGIEAPS
jgi:transposase